METYGDPFSLYRICPALMEPRLDSGTYVCLDDSSFLVLFSSASYIIHRFKAVLHWRRSHLLTWKSHGGIRKLSAKVCVSTALIITAGHLGFPPTGVTGTIFRIQLLSKFRINWLWGGEMPWRLISTVLCFS